MSYTDDMLAAKLQGIYFIFMGAWPLLHLKSFEFVTGTKKEKWLLKTIAWLFIVIGLQLWTGDPSEVWPLGIGAAAVIGTSDVYYGLVKERIAWTYAVDALPQILFIVGWLLYLYGSSPS